MPPTSTVAETNASQSTAWVRGEPYVVFFPLGILLSWTGVAHWLGYALGVIGDYRPIFHSMVQIQGFMMCFAVGFLFTMIPRRTGTDPPSLAAIVACAAATVVTTAAAWGQHWMVAQAAWLALALTVMGFTLPRLLGARARRRPPNSFVWIPLALAMGIAGSLLTGLYAALGPDYLWLHNVGRGLVLQGMFVGLAVGVGGLAFPLMTRGAAPADASDTVRDRVERACHVAAAIVLVISFFVEALFSLRLGMLLRALLVTSVLAVSAELWRLPSVPGWNRLLIWVSGWTLPLGYYVAALWPMRYKAGLHITFIGGFALLALAVSTQVTLGHRGYRQVLLGKPPQTAAIGVLMALAAAARVTMEFDRVRYFDWMGVAASAFLAATLTWLVFLLPKIAVRGDSP